MSLLINLRPPMNEVPTCGNSFDVKLQMTNAKKVIA
jgi:hypothetical protein